MFPFPTQVVTVEKLPNYRRAVWASVVQKQQPGVSLQGDEVPAMNASWYWRDNNGSRPRRGIAADEVRAEITSGSSTEYCKRLLDAGYDPALVAAVLPYAVGHNADQKHSFNVLDRGLSTSTRVSMNEWTDLHPSLESLWSLPMLAKDDPLTAFNRLDLSAFPTDQRRTLLAAYAGIILLKDPDSSHRRLHAVELFEKGCPDWLPFIVERGDQELVADVLAHAGDVLPHLNYNGDKETRSRLGAVCKHYIDRLIAQMRPEDVMGFIDANLTHVEQADPRFLSEFGIASAIAKLAPLQSGQVPYYQWGIKLKPFSMQALAREGAHMPISSHTLVDQAAWLAADPSLPEFENGVLLAAFFAVSGKGLDYLLGQDWVTGSLLDKAPTLYVDVCRAANGLVGELSGRSVDAKVVGAALTAIAKSINEFEEQKRLSPRDAKLRVAPTDIALVRYAGSDVVAAACTTPLRLTAMLKYRPDALTILPHIDAKLRAKGMDELLMGQGSSDA